MNMLIGTNTVAVTLVCCDRDQDHMEAARWNAANGMWYMTRAVAHNWYQQLLAAGIRPTHEQATPEQSARMDLTYAALDRQSETVRSALEPLVRPCTDGGNDTDLSGGDPFWDMDTMGPNTYLVPLAHLNDAGGLDAGSGTGSHWPGVPGPTTQHPVTAEPLPGDHTAGCRKRSGTTCTCAFDAVKR